MQIDIMQSRHFSRNLVAGRLLMRCRGLQPRLKGLWKGRQTGEGAGGGREEAEKVPLAQGSKVEPAGEMDASRELPMRLSINGFV